MSATQGARAAIVHAYNRLGRGSIPLLGAEVGVQEGINAESILNFLNIKQLTLVDPYGIYRDVYNIEDGSWAEPLAHKRLKPWEAKLVWVKVPAEVKGPFDFVYIDGAHTYEAAAEDIEHYSKLINKGGVMGGHDFEPIKWDGVIKAVWDYANKNELPFSVRSSDWWIDL